MLLEFFDLGCHLNVMCLLHWRGPGIGESFFRYLTSFTAVVSLAEPCSAIWERSSEHLTEDAVVCKLLALLFLTVVDVLPPFPPDRQVS